jgi:hypothetical protein
MRCSLLKVATPGGSRQFEIVKLVTIHDVASGVDNTCQGTSQAGIHVDCVQTQGGINITFRSNVFYDCPTSNIQAQPFSGAAEAKDMSPGALSFVPKYAKLKGGIVYAGAPAIPIE